MNLCKVGNQTSSQDPHAVNSRIFVGNLNTFQVNKIDVEKVFQRYGRIVGISMHKGYAFVQFANPFDARSACLGEDGRTISGQVIDVNMVSEPKAHQQSKPKNQTNKTQTNPDNPIANGPEAQPQQPPSPSVDSEGCGGDSNGPSISRKRARSEGIDGVGGAGAAVEPSWQPQENLDLNSLKTYDLPDILICGNCKDLFSNLTDMIEHKKKYCKLRFTCKCGPPPPPSTPASFQALSHASRSRGFIGNHAHSISGDQTLKKASPSVKQGDLGVSLLCTSCHESFAEPLDLLIHVQEAHSVEIFEEHRATTGNIHNHSLIHILMEC